MRIRMAKATATGDGAVTVIGAVCPGGEFTVTIDQCFTPDVFDSVTAPKVIAFVAQQDSATSGRLGFTPNASIGVGIEIGVDAGRAGTAALDSVVVDIGTDEPAEQAMLPANGAFVFFANAYADGISGCGRGRSVCV
jgi:hypothetical protein